MGREIIHRRYLIGVATNSTSRGCFLIVFAWLLVEITGSVASVGWLLIWSAVVDLTLSPFIGYIADRYDRRIVWAWSDGARAFSLVCCGLIFGFGTSDVLVLYVFGALVLVFDRSAMTMTQSLVVDLATPDGIRRLNARAMTRIQIGNILGAAIGGVALALFPSSGAILVSGFCFGCASYAAISIPDYHRSAVREKSVYANIRGGIAIFLDNPELWRVTMAQALLTSCALFINTLLPSFTQLDLQASELQYAVADGAWGVGAIAASAILTRRSWPFVRRRTDAFLGALLAISVLFLSFSKDMTHAILACVLVGSVYSAWRIYSNTVMHEVSGAEYIGRVRALAQAIIALFSLFLYIHIGIIGDLIGSRGLFLGYSALCVLITVVIHIMSICAPTRSKVA